MVDSGNTYSEKISKLITWGHWFSFFNIIAAMLIATRYISQSPWPETLLAQTYLVSTWIGHFAFLVFGFYILVLFPLTFLIPFPRLMRIISIIFATASMTLLLFDTDIYRTLHLHITPAVLDMLINNDLSNNNSQWQYLFVIVPAIFLLQLTISEWIWHRRRQLAHKHVGRPFAIFFAVSFIASHLIHSWADAFAYKPVMSQRAEFPLSYPMTARSFLNKHGFIDLNAQQKLEQATKSNLVDALNYPLATIDFAAKRNNYNLQIIMIDSLRADTLNQTDTPNLTRFAQNNLNFNNHYSANNNSTSLFSLFYGLPGSYINSFKDEAIESPLLSELSKRNYQFGLFSGDNFDLPLYKDIIFTNQNINQSNDRISDDQAIQKWHQWFDKQTPNQPWFSYLELTSVSKYDAANPILINGSTENSFDVNYRKAVNKMDQQLASVLLSLKQSSEWENTIVVITSNHGMEFNETKTNSWGSNTNFSQYQLRVPMLIHWPEASPELIITRSSHLDLAPTLMGSFLNTTTAATDYSSGINLLTQQNSPRQWLLAGDQTTTALITDSSTIVIDSFGNYKVYNKNYNLLVDENPKLSLLMQGISELKRFYYHKK